MAFTRGPQPLQNALLDSLTPGRGECTMVVRDRHDEIPDLIGQVSHPYQSRVARLTFIGPSAGLQAILGARLLDALAQSVGRRGAQNLVAEVDEGSSAFESLREAGFAIYARQRIWRWEKPSAPPDPHDVALWQPEHDRDQTDLTNLYQDLVPGLVQQVEPAPNGARPGLVFYQDGELLGYADIDRGPLGIWLHPFIHPAVEESESLIVGLLDKVLEGGGHPIYLCVRSYQGWMNAKLGRMGADAWTDQAVMVKRLAARARLPAVSPLPVFEGTRPEPTAPYAPVSDATVVHSQEPT